MLRRLPGALVPWRSRLINMKNFLFLILLMVASAIVTSAQTCGGTSPTWTCTSAQMTSTILQNTANAAVDGDTINFPAGSYAFTTGLTGASNKSISWIGNGSPNSTSGTAVPSASCASNTIITWTIGATSFLNISPGATSPTTRISCFTLETTGASGSSNYPILVQGTCNSSGCPNLRVDNLTIPTGSFCSIKDSSAVVPVNMFGVADHNSVGTTQNICNGIDFINGAYPSWRGIGGFGDNSFASPDSFGGPQQFYIENNTFTDAFGTDTDVPGGLGGGGRVTCRFNVFNGVTSADACTNHGTETTGRARGGREMEAYGNLLTCANTNQGCNGFGVRGGTLLTWGNVYANLSVSGTASVINGSPNVTWVSGSTFSPNMAGAYISINSILYGVLTVNSTTSLTLASNVTSVTGTYSFSGSGQFHYYTALANERRYRSVASWFGCSGSAPWDVNDGAVTVGTYTITGYSGGVISVSGSPWTSGAFNYPGSLFYVVFDETTGAYSGVISNTANSLTISWQGVGGGPVFSSASIGDTVALLGSTLYAAGTQSASFGRGYTVASGVAVSALFHSGSGATINITSIDATGGVVTATLASGGTNFSVGDRAQISQTGSDKGAAIQVLTVSGTAIATFSLIGIELKDTTQSWSTNQWVVSGNPYNVLDVKSGYTYEIGPNPTNSAFTSNTLSYFTPGPDNSGNGPWPWLAGDGYAVMRASQCLDQPAIYGGPLFSGTPALPIESNAQILDPAYEFMDSGAAPSHTAFAVDSQNIIANRNYYATNASFTGATGTGFGTRASRPATCTTGVAYFSTDQGSWNQSGGTNPTSYNLQGVLDECTATNTWTNAAYVPYIYPHPLIGGGPGAVTLSPSLENFGSINVGSSSSPVTFILSNSTVTTAFSISFTLTGANASEFSIFNSGPGSCSAAGNSIASFVSCSVTVTFSPTAAGSQVATLNAFYSGGDSASPQTSALSGTGVSSVTFGTGMTLGVKITNGSTVK
jgi:hypothetical protein